MKTFINVSAIKGEKGTGFEKKDDKGPFECGNCEYFHEGGCHQKDMREKSREPKKSNGDIEVGAGDCCEYIDRLGDRKKSRWRSRVQSR